MHESMMPFPWPPEPEPAEQPSPPRNKRNRVRYAGPTGGILIDSVDIKKRRAAQKAQRAARRRNRHG